MALDQTANFKRVEVSGTHTSGATTISLASGEASELPDPANGEYNLVWWDDTNYSLPSNDPEVEIVRVTGRDTGNDTITVQRGQENTSATAKDTSGSTYRLILSTTAKMFSDIQESIGKFCAQESEITLSEDESITMVRFTVPPGKKLEIYGGSISEADGSYTSGEELELFNHTTGSTEHVITNNSVREGKPLYEGSGEDDVEFRIVNATNSTKTLTGMVSFDVVPQ